MVTLKIYQEEKSERLEKLLQLQKAQMNYWKNNPAFLHPNIRYLIRASEQN